MRAPDFLWVVAMVGNVVSLFLNSYIVFISLVELDFVTAMFHTVLVLLSTASICMLFGIRSLRR